MTHDLIHDQRCDADRRLLFRKSGEGITIRCRTCKRDHLFTWAMLATMQREMNAAAVPVTGGKLT